MNVRSVRNVIVSSAWLASGLPAFAATNVTPSEIAMLPAYCDAKIGSQNPAAVEQWIKQLKRENWDHMHHYCGGLVELNRYYRGNAAQRAKTLRDAMWEFDYVLKNTQPDFYLRADMHYNRGKVWRLLENDGKALGDFQKAIELSPGMPSATIELADLYKKLGKKEPALAALKMALKQFPTNKGLHRRYLELGGDPALLVPSPLPGDEANAMARDLDSPVKTEPVQAEPAQPAAPTGPEASDSRIGNATNPWCRFCPDPVAPKNE
jgi:tetratricopeptide (TPR) repeat protein